MIRVTLKVCAEVAKTLHCADPCRTPMYDAAKNGQLIMFKVRCSIPSCPGTMLGPSVEAGALDVSPCG